MNASREQLLIMEAKKQASALGISTEDFLNQCLSYVELATDEDTFTRHFIRKQDEISSRNKKLREKAGKYGNRQNNATGKIFL